MTTAERTESEKLLESHTLRLQQFKIPDEYDWDDIVQKFYALSSRLESENAELRGRFDFAAHLKRQRDFSDKTFGPGIRTAGVIGHIKKELREIEAAPNDLEE